MGCYVANRVEATVNDWIDGTMHLWVPHIGDNDYYGQLDYQFSTSESVCIDPDVIAVDDATWNDGPQTPL